MPPRLWWSIAAAVVAGAALRIGAARGDLWLDEIWSFALVHDAGSIRGIFARIHHDNNHYLNSLWLLLVGEPRSPIVLRLLALASGAGTLVLVAMRPLKYGRREALTTTLLVAFCFILVQYDSEARGYAPAILLAVGGFHATARYLARRDRLSASLLAACATAGLLAHLSYLLVLTGLTAWAGAALWRDRRSRRVDWAAAVALGPPAIALVLLWAIDLRHLVLGGGPEVRSIEVLRDLLGSLSGAPAGPPELLGLALVALALGAAARLALGRDARAVFFSVTVFLAPALLLVLRPLGHAGPRYLVVVVPFLLMLASLGLCEISSAWGRAGRAAHALAVIVFCAASAVPLARLIGVGRGHYRAAVALMAARTPEATATVGTDHDFRNGLVLAYYALRDPSRKPFALVPTELLAEGDPPRWWLLHDFAARPAPEPEIVSPTGEPYAFVAAFPYSGLSGWHWLVYERLDRRGAFRRARRSE